MRQNGRIHREHRGFTKNSRIMEKYKMRHYETLNVDMFPQEFPNTQDGGETSFDKKIDEPLKDYDQESQPSVDEIWECLGDPTKY